MVRNVIGWLGIHTDFATPVFAGQRDAILVKAGQNSARTQPNSGPRTVVHGHYSVAANKQTLIHRQGEQRLKSAPGKACMVVLAGLVGARRPTSCLRGRGEGQPPGAVMSADYCWALDSVVQRGPAMEGSPIPWSCGPLRGPLPVAS
jgi:hypothetical protein